MRRVLIAFAACVAAVPALAADLGRPGSLKDPWVASPLPSNQISMEKLNDRWGKGFAGAVGTYGDGDVDVFYDRAGHGHAGTGPEGFSGGVFFGKNWLLNRYFFGGIEGEIGYMAIDADDKQVYVDDHVLQTGLSGGYAIAALRAGILLKDRLGLYGKLGGAVVATDNKIWGDDGDGDQDAFDNAFIAGLAYGGGLEWAVTERATLRLEYLRVNFDRHRGISTGGENYSFETNANLWRSGVSFRF